ncbi:MAG: hypothetical protein EOM13_06955, partial [Clostridia bacterium]|nr:hypothetical protein [Clostridia bacterium]
MARKKLYAAIDVGSHEIQMKIAELSREESPRVIEHVRRTLPLGTATYQKGELTPSLLQTCTDVLRGLALKLKEYRIGEVSVLATSAFREAVNQTYAIDQIASQSGGESAGPSLVAGGHVDACQAAPVTAKSLYDAGEIRPLGIMSETRVEAFPDAPTCMEQGYDVVMHNARQILAPKGTPKEV